MNVPTTFRYDPRWQVVATMWALAGGLQVLALAGFWPRTFVLVLSMVFACFGIFTTLRRYIFKRQLVLDTEGVCIPSGFLRMRVRPVYFSDIGAVWETALPFTGVLCMRSKGKTLEVLSTLLPDSVTYRAVCQLILARTRRR